MGKPPFSEILPQVTVNHGCSRAMSLASDLAKVLKQVVTDSAALDPSDRLVVAEWVKDFGNGIAAAAAVATGETPA